MLLESLLTTQIIYTICCVAISPIKDIRTLGAPGALRRWPNHSPGPAALKGLEDTKVESGL